MTALTIPSIPQLPAGYVVQLADLQALASAASFLLAPPMTKVSDQTGGQTVGATGSATTVQFDTALIDVDGAYSSANKGRLTIQTPGWYKIRYCVSVLTSSSGQGPFQTYVSSKTGPNNPAGSGISSGEFWAGYSNTTASAAHCFPGAAGLWPQYLYSGDYLQVAVFGQASGATTSITDPSGGSPYGGSWFSIEYVSVS